MTIADVGEALRISRAGVYRLLERGDLIAIRVGERPRFAADDVRAFLDRQREEP